MASGRGSYGGASFSCMYPGCTKPRYKEPYGYTHDFCGKTHADLFRQRYGSGSTTGSRHSHPLPGSSATTTNRQPLKAVHSLSLPSGAGYSYGSVGRRLDSSNEIKFYNQHDPYYEFTNFYFAPIKIDGKRWPTSEHYFQAQKFIGTPYVEKIRKFHTAREAFQLSRDPKVSRWRRADWEQVKDDVMLKALRCKFDQHEHLARKLLETGEKKLIEHTFNDSYWGDGGNGTGQNKLGTMLMEIRRELRKKHVTKSSLRRSGSFHGSLTTIASRPSYSLDSSDRTQPTTIASRPSYSLDSHAKGSHTSDRTQPTTIASRPSYSSDSHAKGSHTSDRTQPATITSRPSHTNYSSDSRAKGPHTSDRNQLRTQVYVQPPLSYRHRSSSLIDLRHPTPIAMYHHATGHGLQCKAKYEPMQTSTSHSPLKVLSKGVQKTKTFASALARHLPSLPSSPADKRQSGTSINPITHKPWY